MSRSILRLRLRFAWASLARIRLAAAALYGELVERRPLEGQLVGGRLLELLQLRRAFLRSARLASRTFFWAAVCSLELAGVEARLGDRLVERGERRLVLADLGGEGLVLVADVDEVADVGQGVRERVGRQDGLEERRPLAVVGRPDVLGEEGLALGELGRLCVLLGLDLGELGVEVGELGRPASS